MNSERSSLPVDIPHRQRHTWYRRAILGLISLFVLLALLNVFGQRSETAVATGGGARLELRAPDRLRTGDIFEARFEITTSVPLDKPAIVLAPDWLQGITLNSLEPAPVTENSTNNVLRLGLEPLQAGQTATVWTQWQVNPTGFGDRDTSVKLYNRDTELVSIDRTTTVFP
jgi:hypothetical protein